MKYPRSVILALTGTAIFSAHAQHYPQRPVRVIVNVSAGGGVDSLSRITGAHMSAAWGYPFVIDNRTGAGGAIGTKLAAKSAPDSYTPRAFAAEVTAAFEQWRQVVRKGGIRR